MSDGSTTIVLVEAAIELAMIEKATLRLTVRGSAPGALEKINGAPRVIEREPNGAQTVVLDTDIGERRVPLASILGARRL